MSDVYSWRPPSKAEVSRGAPPPREDPKPVEDPPPRPIVSVTVFTSSDRLSKLFTQGPDETIHTDSGVRFSSGTARRFDLPLTSATDVLTAFGEIIRRLTSKQAIGLGRPKTDAVETRIVTKSRKANGAAESAITRSLDDFTYQPGPGVLLIDGDGYTGLRDILIDLAPVLARVAMLTRPSASAGIVNSSTGETLKGGGEHVYLPVDQVDLSKQVLQALMRLSWARGFGVLKIAANGMLLVRGPVDTSVGSPERLSYEGAVEVEPPIVAPLERPITVVDGDMLKVVAFLTWADREAPEDEFERLKQEAARDPKLIAEQLKVHEGHLNRTVARKVANGIPETQAKAEAQAERKAFQPGVLQAQQRALLYSSDVFLTADGSTIRLSDVRADPGKYDGTVGCDPGEGPEYGRSCAMICANPKSGRPFINSFAHGGIVYEIQDSGSMDKNTRGGSAAELQTKRFEPLRRVADPFFVEGCTLFAGNPKIGKSWLFLQTAIGVALGTPAFDNCEPCEPGDVLYLALEDNERRMQRRMTKLLGLSQWPANLDIFYSWPRAHEGGLDAIRKWAAEKPNPRMVLIDVLGCFRKPVSGKDNAYQSDSEALRGIQQLAGEAKLSIPVAHHTRKSAAEGGDPFEVVSGTMGLTGTADAVLVLRRENGMITLYGRGRDTEDLELGMSFDREAARWSILGRTADVRRSDERKAILDVLRASPDPMFPRAIVDATERPEGTVRRLLYNMLREEPPPVRKVGNAYTLTGKLVDPAAPAAPEPGAAYPRNDRE